MTSRLSRRELIAGAGAAAFAPVLGSASGKPNPRFVPGEPWLDDKGEIINAHGAGFLYDKSTYYWFGEWRGGPGVPDRGVSCYSSSDLYTWRNEGIALPFVTADPEHPLARGAKIERPKVIYNRATRTYVMWFHLELKGQGYSAARAGVAVSERATGPYRFLNSFRPNGEMSRDLTLFVDDDGAAYLFTASENNRTMHVHLLNGDYRQTSEKRQRIFAGRMYEAPAVFKHAGRYYFLGSHCTGWKPNPAVSAIAESVWGPWTEHGNPAQGTNANLTFLSQSAYVLPVQGRRGAFIAMFDRWRPENQIDSRYVWLPVEFGPENFTIRWRDSWDLSQFD